MQIKLKRQATVMANTGKWNPGKDEIKRHADLSVTCDEKQLANYIGAELAKVAFAGWMPDPDGGGSWRTKAVKFSAKIKPEIHIVTIGHADTRTEPKINKLLPVSDAPQLDMTIRIVLDASDAKLVKVANDSLGTTIDLHIKPAQEDLPGVG